MQLATAYAPLNRCAGDASAILHVLSFADVEPIVSSLQVLVSSAFRREALFVYEDDGRTRKVAVDDDMIMRAGLVLEDVTLSASEFEAYAEHAAFIDDGEAQALAIAEHRGIPLLTDDRAAIRRGRQHGIEVFTTLHLLAIWAQGRDRTVIARAVTSLRSRGTYAPPRGHPHASWFREHLDESSPPAE